MEGATTFLDSSVMTWVVDSIKDVLGLVAGQPILATFVTIGLVGTVSGMALNIISRVKNA